MRERELARLEVLQPMRRAAESRLRKCGAETSVSARFCSECATPLGVSSPPQSAATEKQSIRIAETSASENLEGERKTVTALLADIKGSMELIEDLDPEKARAIVDPALKVMMEAVQR